MTQTSTDTRSVVIERQLPHPPEKVWRALSQPDLIKEWLMQNDFAPVVGHRFKLSADWGHVDCEVLAVDLNRTLSYTWCAFGGHTVVTFTLTPSGTGTLLRMEQAGFPQDQRQAYHGAKQGWARFLETLEQVLARPDGAQSAQLASDGSAGDGGHSS
jgi:uncharacterized protein YndB with AHSA1/START domain